MDSEVCFLHKSSLEHVVQERERREELEEEAAEKRRENTKLSE